jgi:hypothetical protein
MKNFAYLSLALIGAISIGGATVGMVVLVGAVIERLTGSSSLGIPYQIGVSIAGTSLAVFLLYCSYLLIARWSACRLFRAIRMLTVILIVDAIAATTAFFLVTGILNIVSLLWLCMALAFGTIVLVLVHKLLAETIPDSN